MSEPTDIDIQWGGYYASREQPNGPVGIFRLLDFNRDAYHAALYKEEFSDVPSLVKIVSLSPFVGHAPIDARGLLRPSFS